MSHADPPGPDPLNLPDDGLMDPMAFDAQPPGGTAPADAEAESAEGPLDPKKKKREKKAKKERKEKKAKKEKVARVEARGDGAGPSLAAKIRQASPYTVMLAIALASLVIATAILVLYLGRYDFKFRP